MRPNSVTLRSWSDIHGHAKNGWLYRGQRDASWDLQTSLERCCDRQGFAANQRPIIETELSREFRRGYHQYAEHVPGAGAVLEWLSLMQHHGAPTRLLDFTYSIYVATCFALEAAYKESAVWAIDANWAIKESERAMRRAGKPETKRLLDSLNDDKDEKAVLDLFFTKPYVRSVAPLNPFRLNERLRIQKGVFVVPGDARVPFMRNLEGSRDDDGGRHVIKIVIPRAMRREGLRHLFEMNISRTSLFPGLDGYAESLGV